MNRRLHLDTESHASHSGINRRHSILQTPLEMHAPGVQPPTNDDPDYAQPSSTTDATYAADATDAANKEMGSSSEKTQQPTTFPPNNHSSAAIAAPPYIMPGSPPPPPPEQHPANFAPYADEMTQQHHRPVLDIQPFARPDADHAIVSQNSYGTVPNSPGPLPIKGHPTHADQQQQQDPNTRPLAVEPDTNPLQSPLFPPPTATSTSQQTPVPEDITTYHQPGQVRHPNQAIKGGAWTHSLCDCSNISACCLGIFCPCILYGKTQYRLGLKSRKEDPTNMLGFGSCNGSCTAMALLCGCQWLLATIQHTRTRKAYDIPGNVGSDCVRATCCTCCTLIQDETEIIKREDDRARLAAGHGATMVSPYVTPAQMSYPPPPR